MQADTSWPPRRVTPWTHPDGRRLTGAGVTVGVIDSGWRSNPPDHRVGRGVVLTTPVPSDICPEVGTDDSIGHGTMCTRLLLRVAPEVRVVPIKVFGRRLETSIDELEQAVAWGASHELDLLSMSLGTHQEHARDRLYHACFRALEKGTLIVAASSGAVPSYPAAFDVVISAGAGDFHSDFEYAMQLDEKVECLACAAWPTAADVQRGFTNSASFAAPRIAGLVALLLELRPGAGISEVRAELLARASAPYTDSLIGDLPES